MKKILLTLSLTAVIGSVFANQTITVGASPVPHAEMLKYVKPALAKEGYDLKIVEFSDYITPNLALTQKQLDANFFQHKPYLDQYNKDHKTNLVPLVAVHLEPMGVYADKQSEAKFMQSKKAADISSGAKIGVPNDPTNEGRALNILQTNGVIKIKAGVAYPTKSDIIANPYKVQIVELDPAMLPRALASHQLNLAVINSNFALSAGMSPLKNAVVLESKNSPFANIIVIRPEEAKEPAMKALAKAMTSPEMKKFIETKYNGAIIPVF